MTKIEAIEIIDRIKDHRDITPGEMLYLVWLRVIINQIPDADWKKYLAKAVVILSD